MSSSATSAASAAAGGSEGDEKQNKNSEAAAAAVGDDALKLAVDDQVLRMLLDVHPWPETINALHEKFTDETTNSHDKERLKYLVEKVFPTLVPAMSELSEVVRRDVDARSGHPAAPPSFPATRCSPAVGEGKYQATGVVHPVVWLAQRLMRGGPGRGVVSDEEHPFCELLRRAPPASSLKK